MKIPYSIYFRLLVAILLFLIIIYLIIMICFFDPEIIWPLLFFFIPLMAIFLFIIIKFSKEVFGFIAIEKNGITASRFGKPWFVGTWDKIQYVGVFSVPGRLGPIVQIYFSKEPVILENNVFVNLGILEREGLAVYFPIKPTTEQEVLKYVDPDCIIQHGVLIAFN